MYKRGDQIVYILYSRLCSVRFVCVYIYSTYNKKRCIYAFNNSSTNRTYTSLSTTLSLTTKGRNISLGNYILPSFIQELYYLHASRDDKPTKAEMNIPSKEATQSLRLYFRTAFIPNVFLLQDCRRLQIRRFLRTWQLELLSPTSNYRPSRSFSLALSLFITP